MNTLTFTKEGLEHALAQTASETCAQLSRLGFITAEQYETFTSEWTPVLINRKSILEKLRKLAFKQEDESILSIRFIQLNETNEKENKQRD